MEKNYKTGPGTAGLALKIITEYKSSRAGDNIDPRYEELYILRKARLLTCSMNQF